MKAELSIKLISYFAPNCPRRIVAPNCPRQIVQRRIVRAELSCAELSGNRPRTPTTPLRPLRPTTINLGGRDPLPPGLSPWPRPQKLWLQIYSAILFLYSGSDLSSLI